MVIAIGVLALQGGFAEHEEYLKALGVQTRQVRLPHDLQGLQGLIIPGGESTTIIPLLKRWKLMEAIEQRSLAKDLVLWGTCAGAILLANRVRDLSFKSLGYIDILMGRNAYGAQLASFESKVNLEKTKFGKSNCMGVFIRAPKIMEVGNSVTVLGRLDDGAIVAVEQGHCMATTFHPELTGDLCFHKYFINKCVQTV